MPHYLVMFSTFSDNRETEWNVLITAANKKRAVKIAQKLWETEKHRPVSEWFYTYATLRRDGAELKAHVKLQPNNAFYSFTHSASYSNRVN